MNPVNHRCKYAPTPLWESKNDSIKNSRLSVIRKGKIYSCPVQTRLFTYPVRELSYYTYHIRKRPSLYIK